MKSKIGEILTLVIRDPDTNEKITVRYRRPFTRERLGYAQSLWDPDKRAYRSDEEIDEIRIEWGEKIIQGIEIESAKRKIISSDQSSDVYCEDWKERIMEKSPQIFETLAFKAFQSIDLGSIWEASKEKTTNEKDELPEKKF